jgi:hypothetical protein
VICLTKAFYAVSESLYNLNHAICLVRPDVIRSEIQGRQESNLHLTVLETVALAN